MIEENKPDDQPTEGRGGLISPGLPPSRSARAGIYESAARALGLRRCDTMEFGFFDQLQWERPRFEK